MKSGSSEQKRVGGEIVEQGWIVSVPWGIVPGGDLRTAEGERGRRSVNEKPIIIKHQGSRTNDRLANI